MLVTTVYWWLHDDFGDFMMFLDVGYQQRFVAEWSLGDFFNVKMRSSLFQSCQSKSMLCWILLYLYTFYGTFSGTFPKFRRSVGMRNRPSESTQFWLSSAFIPPFQYSFFNCYKESKWPFDRMKSVSSWHCQLTNELMSPKDIRMHLSAVLTQ